MLHGIAKLVTCCAFYHFQELIQNADDAGATEIKFMVDHRHHGNDNLWLPGLANFQGPALLAWNNAEFSEEDWESVFHIYKSLKKTDPMKVGRFGLGFISVYHITGMSFFTICILYDFFIFRLAIYSQ